MAEKDRQAPSNGVEGGSASERPKVRRSSAPGLGSVSCGARPRGFSADNLTDRAAALTYYGIQAIFPALLALVSILGLLGRSATQPLIDNLDKVAPGPAQQIFTSAIENMQRSRGTAGLLVIVGIRRGAVVGVGLRRRVHASLQRHLRRRRGPAVLARTPASGARHLRLVLLLAVSALAVVLTGGLAAEVGRLLGHRSERSHGVGHRQVAGARADRRPDVLDPVLGRTERPRAGVRWLTPGGSSPCCVDHRLGGVRLLRGQLQLLQQDLRQPRRNRRVPRLALDLRRGQVFRRRAELRGRTGRQLALVKLPRISCCHPRMASKGK